MKPYSIKAICRNKKAFTLIELLVVIAIIAILAAILFPVFAQAREKARQAACLSNTKQIALGVQQYTQDYDELLPVIGDNAACRGRWQWQIYSYVKNEQVFTCPNIPGNKWSSTTQAANTLNAACGTNQVSGADISGYGWSGALAYDNRQWGAAPTSAQTTASPGYSLADIKKPAETLLVGDVSYEREAGYYMYAQKPTLAPSDGTKSAWYYPNFRHNVSQSRSFLSATSLKTNISTFPMPTAGRANFVFLDGHAKSLDLETAFKEAKVGTSYVEDGVTLATGETNSYTSHYVYWNIY